MEFICGHGTFRDFKQTCADTATLIAKSATVASATTRGFMPSGEIDDLLLQLLIKGIPTPSPTLTELLDRSVSRNRHCESSSAA
jgi:hypothetical protein